MNPKSPQERFQQNFCGWKLEDIKIDLIFICVMNTPRPAIRVKEKQEFRKPQNIHKGLIVKEEK